MEVRSPFATPATNRSRAARILAPPAVILSGFALQLLLCVLCARPDCAFAAGPPVDAASMASFVDGAVAGAMERDHIAGVSVAIVDRSGVVLAKGYGISALEPSREMTPDTLSRVGSISKTIVWIALMQLVEQGKLKLVDPINEYLPPSLRVPDDGFKQPVRIWHLMTHTAGLEETVLGHMEVENAADELPLTAYLARYRPHRVLPPGEIAVYSNYGAALAGVIVAQRSGLSWEDYAEQRILQSLGMHSTTFREALPPALARHRHLPQPMSSPLTARLSHGFRWQDGRLEETPPELITHYAPAGALVTTATDMTTYMRALLDPTRLEQAGVLTAPSARTMLEPLFSNAPGFGTLYHGFFQFSFPGSQRAFGHDGDTRYQHAIMIIAPDIGVGVFVATNTPSGIHLVQQLPYLIGLEMQRQGVPPIADSKRSETNAVRLGADCRGGQALAPLRPGSDRAALCAASANAASDIQGSYRPLRRPYFRTERVFLAQPTTTVRHTDNGNVIVSGGSDDATRYAPEGGGLYRRLGSPERIAFRRWRGGVLLLDSAGADPLERVGFLAGTGWLLLMVALTHVVSVWGSIQLVRDSRRAQRQRLALAWDATAAVWLSALVIAWVAVTPWLRNTDDLLMRYPGVLFPLACWLFAFAAAATVIMLGAVCVIRPTSWSWRRWLGTSVSFVVFAGCALTFRYWGLLGFSGW